MIDKTDPTNRDTVPAMLTPGEFVLNKEASEMYGPVIEQMNQSGLQQRAIGNAQLESARVNLNIGGTGKPKDLNTVSRVPIRLQVAEHEGYRDYVYDDGSGNPTIGYGHLLPDSYKKFMWDGKDPKTQHKPFSTQQLKDIFTQDLKEAEKGAKNNFSNWDTLPKPVQDGLTNMAFQLGEAGQSKFKLMRKAVENNDFEEAAVQAQDSLWATQTPTRSTHLVNIFKDQNPKRSTDPISSGYQEYTPKDFIKEADTINTPGSAMLSIPEVKEAPPMYAIPSDERMRGGAVNSDPIPPATTFNEAFKQARKDLGAGKVFTFNGSKFSTNYSEEDEALKVNMGGKACSCGKKKICDCGLGMTYANMGKQIPIQYLNFGESVLDEDLLRKSSQMKAEKEEAFRKQIEMQKFMEYQQQQRGIASNKIPMTYDLETRKMGNPSYRQQASDNELFGGPLNYVNDGPTLKEEIARDQAGEDELINAPPAMNVPINPPKIKDNPRRDDGLVVSPPPTFKDDVVPFLKRIAHIDDIKSGLTKFDKAFGGVQPVGSVDVNKEYRDLKALLANGDISEGQRKAYEIRIAQIEREQDYNKKMEPYSSRNVAKKVLEAGNSLATDVDRFVTGKVGETVSSFNPNMGSNILDSVPPVYEAPPPRELSQNEIEFNNLRSGKVVPTIDAIGLDTFSRQQLADETRRQQSQINPVKNKLETKEKVNTALTNLQPELEKEKTVPNPDPDNLPPTEQKDIPEAKSALKDFFGDIFDSKELARAAIMYLGGRATGMSGNQALAFAGKQYINRSDARENTYQTYAASGKYTKPSLALYKKTRDPNSLILKSVPLINMGDPKEYYDTITNRRFIAQKMKDSLGNMIWMMPDGKTPVDFTRTTDDARYVEDSPENIEMKRKLVSNFSKQISQNQELVKNRTSGENKNERVPYLQIGADQIGKAATKFMLKNGIKEEAMGQILGNIFDEAVYDLKNNRVKEINDLDSYFRRAYIEVSTRDAVNFKLKDGEPVSPVSVVSFLNVIRRIGESVEGNLLKDKSDAALSTWLTEQDAYKAYQALPQSDKDKYIQEGMLGKENDRQSGMMVYILKQLAPR